MASVRPAVPMVQHGHRRFLLWTAATIWLAVALVMFALIYGQRNAGAVTAPLPVLALSIAGDGLLFAAIGWRSAKLARSWRQKIARPAEIARSAILNLAAFFVIAVVVLPILAGLFVPQFWPAWLGAGWSLAVMLGFALDAGLLLIVAASVVPLALVAADAEKARHADPVEYLAVGAGRELQHIHVDQILMLRAADNYVEVLTPHGRTLHRASLSSMADLLNGRFVRLSRSVIVHRSRLVRLWRDSGGQWSADTDWGETFAVARRCRAEVAGTMGDRSPQ